MSDDLDHTDNPVGKTAENSIKTFSMPFKMSVGTYTCDEICEIINQQINYVAQTNQVLNNQHSLNPLLQKSWQYAVSGKYNFINDDQSNDALFQVGNSKASYLFGSSNFSLGFDGEKFKFETINVPHFTCLDSTDSDNGHLAIAHILTGNLASPDANCNVVDKAGGISFTALKPSSLWNHVFGFGETTCVKTKAKTYAGARTECVDGGLTDGLNTTGGGLELDAGLKKTGNSLPCNFNTRPSSLAVRETVSDAQTEIYASQPYSIKQIKSHGGHMLLDVDLGVNCNYTGESLHLKHIFGIITDYHRSDNFLIGDQNDAPTYVHKGQPVSINSIRVRILNALGNVVGNLDQDNAIFLSLLKTETMQPPTKSK